MRRRHRFYRHVFVVSLLVMASMPLPYPFRRFALSGTALLIGLLAVELGQPIRARQIRRHWSDVVYRLTGLTGIALQFTWMASPSTFAFVGFPVLLVITVFIFWSLKRLLICLAQETRIGMPVLSGAVAGYLMLGISGGLLFSVMETVAPGSFINLMEGGRELVLSQLPLNDAGLQVWSLDFTRIHYFAFVSLTTVGYGDIIPATPPAQMASVALSICGPLYLAIVMGLLISRYTLQSEVEEAQVKERSAGVPAPPPRSGADSVDR
ncbi:MAG: potassium channel family protein [Cyanobium sp.]